MADLYSSPKLLKNSQGKPLSGFYQEFLSAWLKSNTNFPQTQAVIAPAMAKSILGAVIGEDVLDVQKLFIELFDSNTENTVDYTVIGKFVEELYKRKKFKLPTPRAGKLQGVIIQGIEGALKAIDIYAMVLDVDQAALINSFEGEVNGFKAVCFLQSLTNLQPEFLRSLHSLMESYHDSLSKNQDAISLVSEFEKAIVAFQDKHLTEQTFSDQQEIGRYLGMLGQQVVSPYRTAFGLLSVEVASQFFDEK